MNVYLIGALVVAFLVGAAGYQGFQLGGDSARAEFAAEKEQARAEAEAYSKGLRASARKQAANLQIALGKQKKLTNGLRSDLDIALAQVGAEAPGCPAPKLSDKLLDIWNAANTGSRDAGRGLSITGGTAANPDRPKLGGNGEKSP